MKRSKRTLYDCDRCKFTYKKINLRRQRGMMLCDGCFDSVLELAPVNMKFHSPRENSTSTTAVNTPTTFTISTAGITALQRSQMFTREGGRKSYVMHVDGASLSTTQALLLELGGSILLESGGSVLLEASTPSGTEVTANPQIVAGIAGNTLTLVGTSDTDYVILRAGNGTDLTEQMVLYRGSSITLVYNATSSLWCETSRLTGGIVLVVKCPL